MTGRHKIVPCMHSLPVMGVRLRRKRSKRPHKQSRSIYLCTSFT